MDEEIQSRRHEEMEALQAFYGEQFLPCLPTSNVPNQNQSLASIDINGPWYIQLTSNDASTLSSSSSLHDIPTLEIRLPKTYPIDTTVPTPLLHNVGHLITSSQKEDLVNELVDTLYQPEMEVAILWAERCREVIAEATTNNNNNIRTNNQRESDNMSSVDKAFDNLTMDTSSSSSSMDLSLLFLSYNHLLHGKSHKKEAQIVSTASKLGLVGFVTYGTPGIIGIVTANANNKHSSTGISTTEQDVVDFSKECSQIGKKCTLLDVRLELNQDGFMNETRQVNNVSTKKKQSKQKSNESSNQPLKMKGLHPLLVNLLGEERVVSKSTTSSKEAILSIVKKGLNAFASCADLKKVLVERHGLEEGIFQQIIGVA